MDGCCSEKQIPDLLFSLQQVQRRFTDEERDSRKQQRFCDNSGIFIRLIKMSSPNQKIVALIVTYRPDPELLMRNFQALVPQVAEIIVVDNSDDVAQAEAVRQLFAGLEKVHYLWNQGNQGIAFALSQGVRLAEQLGAVWVLTMDQDSVLPPRYVAVLAEDVQSYGDRAVSIGTPFVSASHRFADTAAGGSVKLLITSGNMIRVDAVKRAGYFRDDFFIDYVDFDLSLRLRKLGYLLIESHKISFNHQLGNATRKTLFGKAFSCTNYSPLRFYYMSRNRMVFFKENIGFDPALVFKCAADMLKETLKMLIGEENRKAKMKAILCGVRDGLTGRMGKYTGRF